MGGSRLDGEERRQVCETKRQRKKLGEAAGGCVGGCEMKKESSENEAGCRQQTDQHKEKQVWRDAGEKEMDLEETDTKQEGKQRELSERERAGVSWGKELGGGCRVEPEKNNESPLPPTKTAMSAVPPPPPPTHHRHPPPHRTPSSLPSLLLLLSCCHPVTV